MLLAPSWQLKTEGALEKNCHHSPLKQKSYCHFLYSICHISAAGVVRIKVKFHDL
jgi:hypothetical protein